MLGLLLSRRVRRERAQLPVRRVSPRRWMPRVRIHREAADVLRDARHENTMTNNWRPFEPSKDEIDRIASERDRNRCNLHDDCAAVYLILRWFERPPVV